MSKPIQISLGLVFLFCSLLTFYYALVQSGIQDWVIFTSMFGMLAIWRMNDTQSIFFDLVSRLPDAIEGPAKLIGVIAFVILVGITVYAGLTFLSFFGLGCDGQIEDCFVI